MFQNKRTEISLLLIGFTLIGIGVFVWKAGVTPSKVEIVSEDEAPSLVEKLIYVDVAGEVQKPGVVTLVLGARVNQAITLAGGVTENADDQWMAKYLNQAKMLSDGEKIYIPTKTDSPMETTYQSTVTNKININSASERELDKLPGIGPVTAGKIISGRPYGNIIDLKDRKVVTEKVWEQISELISTW